MNRTFKVVFSHARGCMVAVNEITHSFQKKSTKTVIATVAAAALLGFGMQAQATMSGGETVATKVPGYIALYRSGSYYYFYDDGEFSSYTTGYGNTTTTTGGNITIADEIFNAPVFGAYVLIDKINENVENSSVTLSGNQVTISNSKVEDTRDYISTNKTMMGNLPYTFGGVAYLAASNSVSATTESNTVTVTSSQMEGTGKSAQEATGYVFGGYAQVYSLTADATANSNSNTVDLTDIWVTQKYKNGSSGYLTNRFGVESVKGGFAKAHGIGSVIANANKNNVTVKGDESTTLVHHWAGIRDSGVYGGVSEAKGIDTYNGTTYQKLCQTGVATANENTVSLSKVGSSSDYYIYQIRGGYATADTGYSIKAEANNNEISVANSFACDIRGGYVYVGGGQTRTGTANNNTITVSDSTIKSVPNTRYGPGFICGGYVDGDIGTFTLGDITLDCSTLPATATGNTVILKNIVSLTNTDTLIYGGYDNSSNSSATDVFTGNKLKLYASEMISRNSSFTPKTVANFETIDIILGDVTAENMTIASLAAGDSVVLGNSSGKGTSVHLIGVGSGSTLAVGDKVTLITNASGTLANGDGKKEFVTKEESETGYLATISLEEGTVYAEIVEVDAVEPEPEPEPEPTPDTGGNSEAKVFNEARVANLAFINHGTDILLDLNEQSGPTFGTIVGGHKRYKTGSYADVDGVNLAAGLAHTFKRQSTDTTAGLFVETGYGDITTHNSIGGATQKGDGTSKYVGAGVLARLDVTEGSLKGFYTRLALRAGRLFTDYTNKDVFNGVKYDLDSNYFAGHIGLGYQRNLTNAIQLDTRAQYMFSRITGKNVAINENTYHFDDTDSHRVRAGIRFNYIANPRVNPFVSLAWEHEFDGKAKATLNGTKIDRADISGSTGIVKMGLTIKPSKESRFSLDAGVAGYFGEQEGIHGEIRMQYLW